MHGQQNMNKSQSLMGMENQPHNQQLETLLSYPDSYLIPVSFADAHGRCPTSTAKKKKTNFM